MGDFVPLKFLIEGEIRKGKLIFLKNLMWGFSPLMCESSFRVAPQMIK
jgi:archaellum biogenesis ATPase FlaH